MPKIINRRILVFCVVAFLIGVFLGAISSGQTVIMIIIPLVLLAFGIFFAVFRHKDWLMITVAVLLGIVCITLDFNCFYSGKLEATVEGRGRVEAVGYKKVTVGDLSFEDVEFYGKMQMQTDKKYEVGDILTFSGRVTTFDRNIFDSAQMSLFNSRIYYKMKSPKVIKVEKGRLTLTEKIQKRIEAPMSVMADEDKGIVLSLLLGDKSQLTYEDRTTMTSLGMMHVFAVSGLHVGFLIALTMLALKGLKSKPVLQLVIVGIVLAVYCLLTDFSAGVKRASIMTLTYMAGKLLHRKGEPLTTLAISVFLIVLITPRELFSISFLMSVGAVLGIIMFYKCFAKPLKSRIHNKLGAKVIDSVSITLSANTFLIPISFNVFNTYAVYMVLSNLIILPLISISFMLIAVTALLSVIFSGFGVLYYVVQYPIQLIRWIGNLLFRLPYITLEVSSVFLLTPALILIPIILSPYILCSKERKVISILGLSLLSVVMAFVF